MLKILVSVLLASTIAACGGGGDSQPVPAANPTAFGNLILQGCLPGPVLQQCMLFSGTMVNKGPGCAAGVHGTVLILGAVDRQQYGSAQFSYVGTVKAGETFVYHGLNITTPPPPMVWVYTTTVQWDNVPC
jgi:hypothetical protein